MSKELDLNLETHIPFTKKKVKSSNRNVRNIYPHLALPAHRTILYFRVHTPRRSTEWGNK